MNLLVTGATGFIGSHLCRELLRQGHSVFGLTHSGNTQNITSILPEKDFRLITGDIQDTASMQSIIRDNHIEVIFHLAAQLPEKNDGATPFFYYDVNARGTLNLLAAAAPPTPPRCLEASTRSVDAEPPEYLPVDEAHPTQPHSLYGVTKFAGELLCNTYADRIKITILRYAGAYGPGQRTSDAVYRFIKQARGSQPITIYGDGNQTSDYVYIDDVIQGTASVLAKNLSGVYNIGSGEETSVKALAERILEITGSKSKITFSKTETVRPFRFYLDITRAQKDLGYRARPLAEGLRAYLAESGAEE